MSGMHPTLFQPVTSIMITSTFRHALLFGVVLLLVLPSALTAAEASQPNIVVFLADDLGWNDVGYHGSDIETSHIDALAESGVRLGRHYVYPTCSPTRAGLLTGRNPADFGILSPIAGRSSKHIPHDVVTLPGLLKSQGYVTAITGKWHLGLRPEVGPLKYGFDYSYGYLHGQIDQYTHLYKNGDHSWHRQDRFIDEYGHATDLIADEAVRIIRREGQTPAPFFLYVPFSVPHTPLQEPGTYTTPYLKQEMSDARKMFAASVTHMDDAVGRIVAALDKSGARENTLILLSSDNGGQRNQKTRPTQYGGIFPDYVELGDNRPLRGFKGELYEGGVRAVACLNWPAKLKPGILEAPVSITDWLPTFAALAGAEVNDAMQLDGTNVWPAVTGGDATRLSERDITWKIGRGRSVVRGDWKLIESWGKSEDKQAARVELYNLAADPHEKQDVAAEHPQRVKELQKSLLQFD